MIDSAICILCGGKGSRLKKITKKTPKALLLINKKTIIEYKIDWYKKQKFNNLIFCLGYLSSKIRIFLKKKKIKSNIVSSKISDGILKRIFLAKEYLTKTSIITYGDTIAKLDIKNLLKSHKKSKKLITLVISKSKSPFGLIQFNNKNICSYDEKPTLNYFIGYFVIEKKIFKIIPKKYIDLTDGEGIVNLFKLMIKKKQINYFFLKNLELTVNDINDLNFVKSKIKNYFHYE